MVSYGHLFCFREVNDGPPVPVQEDGLYLQQIWHTLCLVLKLLCILGLSVASFIHVRLVSLIMLALNILPHCTLLC